MEQRKANRPARDRILKAASDLFYAEGIRAVGVDLIITKADVARRSFYLNFSSKDELVVAFLEQRDAIWREWLRDAVIRLAPDPRDRPLAIFDALEERFCSDDFRGCAFINSIVEMANRNHAAHKAADSHKKAVISQISQILDEAGLAGADLAPLFAILVDGAIVTALREGSPGSAGKAKRLARNLLANAHDASQT